MYGGIKSAPSMASFSSGSHSRLGEKPLAAAFDLLAILFGVGAWWVWSSLGREFPRWHSVVLVVLGSVWVCQPDERLDLKRAPAQIALRGPTNYRRAGTTNFHGHGPRGRPRQARSGQCRYSSGSRGSRYTHHTGRVRVLVCAAQQTKEQNGAKGPDNRAGQIGNRVAGLISKNPQIRAKWLGSRTKHPSYPLAKAHRQDN